MTKLIELGYLAVMGAVCGGILALVLKGVLL